MIPLGPGGPGGPEVPGFPQGPAGPLGPKPPGAPWMPGFPGLPLGPSTPLHPVDKATVKCSASESGRTGGAWEKDVYSQVASLMVVALNIINHHESLAISL